MIPKKRLPAEERKKQILRSAVAVFAQSNYRGAKVAEIAAASGVSEAALYKYFPSKKAVFLDILMHMSKRIILMWRNEASREPDALKLLHKMGTLYFKRMAQHPQELKVHFQAVSEIDDPDIVAQLRLDHTRYVRFISGVIEKGIRQGTIRKDADVQMAAWIYNGMGITMNMAKLLSFDQVFDQERVGRIVDFIIDSIKAD
ncbi:MAG: TetR/AcrR family transcriptional regulator [Syntrophales bacterium]|jgi:AcrR family transcriptional regulator|nr:TetR/AcrR family transcriptional regulator [Syntrophales bacterium]MDD5233396.1 TetR/AcrR family transcriptional regulator [Syntrophales bacterium]MDD5532740.1 TetR/AcrR family transcriptional regulator [Syntrophales bacterium]